MILLLDIGNTHTHIGLASEKRVAWAANIPTSSWSQGKAIRLKSIVGRSDHPPEGAVLCSVVPRATPAIRQTIKRLWNLRCFELNPSTLRGVGIDYPKPETIGPDRLANAVAARHHFGAPSIVVDFGTAVTFDVVDRSGNYCGGIIAPGIAALTDYLHEKTALLPRIKIRDAKRLIGRSTEEAMLAGAVTGYRGLVRELIRGLKRELKAPRLPVVATGGYARLIAATLPEITAVRPLLTLDGLRLVWLAHQKEARSALSGRAKSD